MEIRIIKEKDENIVFIDGGLDTASAPDFEYSLKPLYEETKSLVFDCTAMDYISSSGIRLILSSHKKMVSRGFSFILRHINPNVREVLNATGSLRILTIEG